MILRHNNRFVSVEKKDSGLHAVDFFGRQVDKQQQQQKKKTIQSKPTAAACSRKTRRSCNEVVVSDRPCNIIKNSTAERQ